MFGTQAILKTQNDDVTAIVLAGGQGSRMGYQDKAWVSYRNKPLITHVIDAIAPQVNNILVSRNNADQRLDALRIQQVKDNESLGPLSGIVACVELISTRTTLVVPCDIPNLPTNLVSRMSAGLQDVDLVIAKDQQRLQNLVFLAETQCLNTISSYLHRGERSVFGWLATTNHRLQVFDQSFENINETMQLE